MLPKDLLALVFEYVPFDLLDCCPSVGILQDLVRNEHERYRCGESKVEASLIRLAKRLKMPPLSIDIFAKEQPHVLLESLLNRLHALSFTLDYFGAPMGRPQRMAWLYLRKCVRWMFLKMLSWDNLKWFKRYFANKPTSPRGRKSETELQLWWMEEIGSHLMRNKEGFKIPRREPTRKVIFDAPTFLVPQNCVSIQVTMISSTGTSQGSIHFPS